MNDRLTKYRIYMVVGFIALVIGGLFVVYEGAKYLYGKTFNSRQTSISSSTISVNGALFTAKSGPVNSHYNLVPVLNSNNSDTPGGLNSSDQSGLLTGAAPCPDYLGDQFVCVR